MSSAPTSSAELAAPGAPGDARARPAGSAVWRLTAAFAAPLILGAVVLVLGAYAVMVQADVAALRPAILSDADVLRGRILDSEKAIAAPDTGTDADSGAAAGTVAGTGGGAAAFDAPASITQAMLAGRLARQQADQSAGLHVSSFYLYVYRGQVVDGDKGFVEPQPLACGATPAGWGQCLEATGLGGARGWYRIVDLKGRAWGLARRIDVSPAQDGAHGYLFVGRQFAMAEIERRLLNIAFMVLGLACLAAVLLGLLVSRQMLKRVEAVNAVCDRVRQGDLAARAAGDAADDEFGELSRHVNGMLEQINALVLGLRDVSNRIAHDLRTPIARLKADLERAAAAPDLEAAQAGAEAAAAETQSILETFQALLDIAEAEAGADGGLQPTRLDDAARGAVDLYQAVAEDAGVTLVAELEPAPLLGEPSLIVRLAANLVDNAIKFSPPGGRVTVRTVRAGPEVVLSVADQGPGIAPEERQNVLRRFVRAEATRTTPGHGLGLALVAAVAKRHGAKIRMDDTDAGAGLTISVTFRAF